MLEIGKGTFINIRTFEKKYADYSGNFMDSPFMFDLVKRPVKKVKKADEGPELTDARDGQVYKTIQLGEQTWMAENLNFEIEDGVQSWCNGNKGENCDKYGRLYTLAAAKTACPPDWHLPSVDEWPTKGNGGYSAFYAYGVEGWGNAKDNLEEDDVL